MRCERLATARKVCSQKSQRAYCVTVEDSAQKPEDDLSFRLWAWLLVGLSDGADCVVQGRSDRAGGFVGEDASRSCLDRSDQFGRSASAPGMFGRLSSMIASSSVAHSSTHGASARAAYAPLTAWTLEAVSSNRARVLRRGRISVMPDSFTSSPSVLCSARSVPFHSPAAGLAGHVL